MRILLVEDDAILREALTAQFNARGSNLEPSATFEDALGLVKTQDYDVILTEAVLTDGSAATFIRNLRNARIKTPVVVVSALCSAPDQQAALLHAGADDIVLKPYHAEVLWAKVDAVVRRSNGHASAIVEVGDLTINLDSKTVQVNGNPVHLTGREFSMLEVLALRKGITLSKETFITHLYQERDEPEIKIIDVFICKIRKKLAEASGGKNYIETIWGRGYTLNERAPPMNDEEVQLAANG
jgi:two-component system, cell cycle response regulator CtrA